MADSPDGKSSRTKGAGPVAFLQARSVAGDRPDSYDEMFGREVRGIGIRVKRARQVRRREER